MVAERQACTIYLPINKKQQTIGMKRFFVTAAALLAAFSLGAQTPDKEEVKTPL